MTLPRPLLHRIRRAIRRQLLSMNPAPNIDPFDLVEERLATTPTPPNRMKFPTLILILAAFVVAIGLLTSCADRPAWEGTPNPLDTPETGVVRPSAMGRFGPHSEYYSPIHTP